MYHFFWFRIYSNPFNEYIKESGLDVHHDSEHKPPARCPCDFSSQEFRYKLRTFLFLFLFFFNASGGERMMGKLIRTYVVDELNFSKHEGSYINTGFWISFSCGRLAGFLLPRWTTIRVVLLIEVIGLFCGAVLLNIFLICDVNPNITFWICIQVIAFFNGPMFPTGMAWADYHLQITSLGIMIFVFGGGIGGMTHLWVIGYLYDNAGHRYFQYQILLFSTAILIVGLILHTTGSSHKDRYSAIKLNIVSDTHVAMRKQELDIPDHEEESNEKDADFMFTNSFQLEPVKHENKC